jgi:putative nucleotidyltransferase with HDIG domain
MSDTVAIEDLQPGMFIHLDMSWMKHPFPLSSFKLESAEQIAQLKQLGVRRLRWSPEKSDLPLPAAATAGPGPAQQPHADAAPAVVTALPAALSASPLQAQRAVVRRCDAQFNEAAGGLRELLQNLRTEPLAAAAQARALADALLNKMLAEGENCILVLASGAGEKPAAHPVNVAVISLLMAKQFGLSESELRDIGVGALLHDVGKLELPHRVHHGDERMAPGELAAYRDHVRLGVQLGQRMGLSTGALDIVAQHHEHADGSGFPQRLSGERLSIGGRIVAMVNRFDNLCNPAQIQRTLTPHEALSRLFTAHRGCFDHTMLNAFIRMMGVYPAGSIVQLTDDRYAIVMQVNAQRPLKPRVLVHDPAVPREQALYLNLAEAPDLGIRRSLPPLQLPREALDYLRPVRRLAYFFDSMAEAALGSAWPASGAVAA